MSNRPLHTFKIFILGNSEKSVLAHSNLTSICEDFLKGNYLIEKIDLGVYPEKAEQYGILAIPTTIRENPAPIKKIIGDLSNQSLVLKALNLKTVK